MIYYHHLIQTASSNDANCPSNFLCSYSVFLVCDSIQDHGCTYSLDFLCPCRFGPVSQLLHSMKLAILKDQSVQSLSCVRLFATPWTAVYQACLSITNSRSLLKLTSIESVMSSNHLVLCCPLSYYLQSFPASGSFQMSQFFASGGQSIGVSASASVLPMTQDWPITYSITFPRIRAGPWPMPGQ